MGETNNKEIILLKVKVAQLCRVWLFATPLVCGHHALPHPPWDSPGKNIGLGSHSLLQGIFPTQGSNSGILDCRWILYHLSHHLKAKGLSKGSPLKTLTFKPGRLHCPWDFPGKNDGVGCHFLFQGNFLTQESNLHLLCLLHWQAGKFFTTVPHGKPHIGLYYKSD